MVIQPQPSMRVKPSIRFLADTEIDPHRVSESGAEIVERQRAEQAWSVAEVRSAAQEAINVTNDPLHVHQVSGGRELARREPSDRLSHLEDRECYVQHE